MFSNGGDDIFERIIIQDSDDSRSMNKTSSFANYEKGHKKPVFLNMLNYNSKLFTTDATTICELKHNE